MFGRKNKEKGAVSKETKNGASSVSNCSACGGKGRKESLCSDKTTSRKGK